MLSSAPRTMGSAFGKPTSSIFDHPPKKRRVTMSRFVSAQLLLAGGVAAVLASAVFVAGAAAQRTAAVPNLQSGPGGWQHPFGGEFLAVPGSALPVSQDPNQHFVVQTPKQVIFMEEQGQQVRHVYLDVPHTANVKPSWYGESVGRYEGGDLVVDTIGVSTKTVVFFYGTAHTEKLHIVERWHLIDDGNGLEVNITVDDPDTFVQPWRTYQRYQRSDRPLGEFICQENNTNLFDYHMPVAE